MKRKFFLAGLGIFLFIAISSNALAYIDPGTGGAIIGSIWPLIVIIFSTIGAFIVKWFWTPIKSTFSKFGGKKKDK